MSAHQPPPELKSRLEELTPFLQGLGRQARSLYQQGGILGALPDTAFPVADARFRRQEGTFTFHPRGAVYFSISREGDLSLYSQGEGVPIASALAPFAALGRLQDLQGSRIEEAPTEWFPPPRILLDADSSELFIASVSHGPEAYSRTVFVPLEQYINERARLFVEAFQAAKVQAAGV